MNLLNEYCIHILKSERLEDKLIDIPEGLDLDSKIQKNIPDLPNRESKIAFSDKKTKIPRLEHLNLSINRAIAMHHFANHELMAIELFAWALLRFPEIENSFKLDLLRTLKEEQKHFKLYINRIQELGISFGDKPLKKIFQS